MKASSNEMYLNGEYFKNNPSWDIADSAWKAGFINALLQKNNLHPSDVVETGCGAGQVLVELSKLDPGILRLRGYDIAPEAIELAKRNPADRISFFNEDLASIKELRSELLLVIDVVEHIDDFYGFLRRMRSKADHFVFHIPLDLSCRTVMKPHVLKQQRLAVGHIHYFTPDTALWALEDTGYAIIDRVYTKPVVDTEPAKTIKRFVKKSLRNLSFHLDPHWSVKMWGGYSIMVLAK
jgi:SAM-dependent methyltransferase